MAVILMAACCASALGREPGFAEYRAVQESLSHVPPKWRGEWLRARGIDWPGYTSYRQPDSGQGLRMVGKYGRGPSGEVTGQDTLVLVCLGSELAIINFAAVDSPRIITELQLGYLPIQAVVRDSILLTGRNGIDIWSISDPAAPRHCSTIPCFVGDFALRDTLLCFISLDTFMVYSVADPANPLRIGTCPDSGNVTAISGGTAITLDGNSLDLVDITQPSNPHTVGIWPVWTASADTTSICRTRWRSSPVGTRPTARASASSASPTRRTHARRAPAA